MSCTSNHGIPHFMEHVNKVNRATAKMLCIRIPSELSDAIDKYLGRTGGLIRYTKQAWVTHLIIDALPKRAK